jgi:hypothetical protein
MSANVKSSLFILVNLAIFALMTLSLAGAGTLRVDVEKYVLAQNNIFPEISRLPAVYSHGSRN